MPTIYLIPLTLLVPLATGPADDRPGDVAGECRPPLSIPDAFASSRAVFLGEVAAHDSGQPGRAGRICLHVSQSWKGVRTPRVCVGNPVFTTWEVPVYTGQLLLVYARGNATELLIDACTRTWQLNGALDDVQLLDDFGYLPIELDGPVEGNFDGDGVLELADYAQLRRCLLGPGIGPYVEPCCPIADVDADGDVDMRDYAAFQLSYPGT